MEGASLRASPFRMVKNLRLTLRQIRDSLSSLQDAVDDIHTRSDVDHIETYNRSAENTEKRIMEAQEAILAFLAQRTAEIYEDILQKTDRRVLSTEETLLASMARTESELRRAILATHRSASVTDAPHSSVDGPRSDASSVRVDDAIYSMIEDRFRGDPASVRNRQLRYLPYISSVVSRDFPVLDIGCGRGEFLGILAENGIAATGVDTNRAFVEECKANGLAVDTGRVPDCLSVLGDGSLGAITLFQVAEHLEFNTLLELFRQSQRVLRPGGVLIVEIPNITTLSVGASTFWIDPTHVRPLHPEVVKFLAQIAGLSVTDMVYSSPALVVPDLSDLPTPAAQLLTDLAQRVAGPGDVAIIAKA